MQSLKALLLGSLLPIVLIFLAGCGSDLAEVSGKVTLDGKPIQGLEVTFEPNDPAIGTNAIGYTQADGTFVLHYPGKQIGAPPGEYTVRISGGEMDEETDQPPIRVPAKYNSQSELSATVESGENEPFIFELTTE